MIPDSDGRPLMKIDWREIRSVPNMLTLLRLVLLPFIYLSLRRGTDAGDVAAIGLILVAIFTDSLDGYVAHRFNQATNLGRILDPLVDKLAIGCGIIFLILTRDFPLWAGLLIVGRDIIIMILALPMMKSHAEVPPSTLIGKATVIALAGMLLFHIMDLQPHAAISTGVAVALVLLSGFTYFLRYMRMSKHSGKARCHETR